MFQPRSAATWSPATCVAPSYSLPWRPRRGGAHCFRPGDAAADAAAVVEHATLVQVPRRTPLRCSPRSSLSGRRARRGCRTRAVGDGAAPASRTAATAPPMRGVLTIRRRPRASPRADRRVAKPRAGGRPVLSRDGLIDLAAAGGALGGGGKEGVPATAVLDRADAGGPARCAQHGVLPLARRRTAARAPRLVAALAARRILTGCRSWARSRPALGGRGGAVRAPMTAALLARRARATT